MDEAVQHRFSQYPEHILPLLQQLRRLIFHIAAELELGQVEETLKWGEPSYSIRKGLKGSVKTASPVRIDWKSTSPEQYYVFFNCHTKLVDTFRELYADDLEFQGHRAIVLNIAAPFPEAAIKHCLRLALTYQKIKHLPLLGA